MDFSLSEQLEHIIDQTAELICESQYVVALVGAGMSVESGISPFRGKGGLWTKYGEPDNRGYEQLLQDPKQWWVNRLTEQPRPEAAAFETATPNPGHYALVEMEKMGILKHIITQNVDNLHKAAGHTNVAEIHGNRTLLRCIDCNMRFEKNEIDADLENVPPHCPECSGIVKGDTVMFGEPIPTDVMHVCQQETLKADCMLLLGTSAVVYPAAAFPSLAKQNGAQILEINTEGSALSEICDLTINGPTGEVLPTLVQRIREIKEI